jgi:hypothetical protein
MLDRGRSKERGRKRERSLRRKNEKQLAEKLGGDAEGELEDVPGKNAGAIKRSKEVKKEERLRESSQIRTHARIHGPTQIGLKDENKTTKLTAKMGRKGQGNWSRGHGADEDEMTRLRSLVQQTSEEIHCCTYNLVFVRLVRSISFFRVLFHL